MKYVYIYHAWIPKCQVASSGNKLLALTHDTHHTSYIYNNYSVVLCMYPNCCIKNLREKKFERWAGDKKP